MNQGIDKKITASEKFHTPEPVGKYHLATYRELPEVEIVAGTDLDPARLQWFTAAYPGAKGYTSAEEMFQNEKLDVVSICTPNALHAPLSILALKHGVHVLCEKPMAMNAAEARQMDAVAKKADRRLMIHFSTRFHEPSMAMKAQVDAGALGDIYFGRTLWHRRNDVPGFGGWFGIKALSGGGPLIDLGVHRLDLALWLMGFPKAEWVMASTYDALLRERAQREGKKFDVEDLAAASIRFANGAMLTVEASWRVHQKEAQRMETALYGTKGGLSIHNVNGKYEFEAGLYHEQGGFYFDTCHRSFKTGLQCPGIAHFVHAILNNQPHIATAEEGIAVMEILDAIYESARLGGPVCLKQ